MMLPEIDDPDSTAATGATIVNTSIEQQQQYRRQRARWGVILALGIVLVAVGLVFVGDKTISSRSRSSSGSNSSSDGEDVIKSLIDGVAPEATQTVRTVPPPPPSPPSQATLSIPSSKPPLTPTVAAATGAGAGAVGAAATGGAKPAPAPSLQQILDDAAALNADKARQKVNFWGNEIPAAQGEEMESEIKAAQEEQEDMGEEGQDVEVDEERGVCYVENSIELRKAVYEEKCEMIQLASLSNDLGEATQDKDDDDPDVKGEVDDSEDKMGQYQLYKEIVIRRTVTIQGDSVMMPLIDCQESVRCLRVKAGAHLTLRHLRINAGKGEVRPRLSSTEAELQANKNRTETNFFRDEIIEIRGGTVLLEPGVVGADFIGVTFLGDEGTMAEVEESLSMSFGQVGVRIYGNHVFMAGGRVNFVRCTFWDLEYLTPLTDRLRFGDDIFLLRGEAYFTGCIWVLNTVFGLDTGMGLAVSQWGGLMVINFCVMIVNNFASFTAVLGQAIFLGTGAMIITGSQFMFNSAIENFNGVGALTNCAGAAIITATAIQDFYAILGAFGIGFDVANIVGVMVTTHVAANQFLGILYSGLLGGFTYNGAGVYIGHFSPFVSFVSIGAEAGAGGYAYNVGITSFHWSPVVVSAGIWAAFMYGSMASVPAGFLVWIYSPFVNMSGIEVFYGIGGSIFVGLGAAVMGRSPLIELIPIVNLHVDFWIMGSCEPFVEAWAGGPIRLFKPLQGCDIQEEVASTGAREGVNKEPPEGEEEEGGHGGGRRQQQMTYQEQRTLPAMNNGSSVSGTTGNNSSVAAGTNTGNAKRAFETLAKTSILAFGLSPYKQDKQSRDKDSSSSSSIGDDAILQAVLGKGILEMVQNMQRSLSTIRVASMTTTRQDQYRDGLLQPNPVTMHVENVPEAFCGVCGVDILEGKGSEGCDFQTYCDTSFVTALHDKALQSALGEVEEQQQLVRNLGDGAVSASDSSSHNGYAGVGNIPAGAAGAGAAGAAAATGSVGSVRRSTPAAPSSSYLTRRAEAAASAAENNEIPADSKAEARFVILADVDVVTTSVNKTLSMSSLKDALSFALGGDVSDPYHQVLGEEAMQIQVFSKAIDEMFAHFYPEELGQEGGYLYQELRRRLQTTEGGGEEWVEEDVELQVHKHTVILTSNSKPKTRRTLRALGVRDPVRDVSRHLEMREGEEDPGEVRAAGRETTRRRLQEQVQQAGDDPAVVAAAAAVEATTEAEEAELGVAVADYLRIYGGAAEKGVESVSLSFEKSLYIPAYDAEVFVDDEPLIQDTGKFSVELLDPLLPSLPIDHLGYKKDYQLTLRNFPANARVQVVALRVAHEEEEEIGGVGTLPWRCPLAVLTTDSTGSVVAPRVHFAAPLTCPPGDYQIRATVLKSGMSGGGTLFGVSNLFELSKEGRKRKLYGTTMWL